MFTHLLSCRNNAIILIKSSFSSNRPHIIMYTFIYVHTKPLSRRSLYTYSIKHIYYYIPTYISHANHTPHKLIHYIRFKLYIYLQIPKPNHVNLYLLSPPHPHTEMYPYTHYMIITNTHSYMIPTQIYLRNIDFTAYIYIYTFHATCCSNLLLYLRVPIFQYLQPLLYIYFTCCT